MLFYSLYAIDNMPVTWCYQGEPGQQFCTTGFPMGCYLPKNGKAKDACVMNVKIFLFETKSFSFSIITIFNFAASFQPT